MADLAGHINIRQEVHFYFQDAVALACFAASPLHIEGEAPCLIAAHPGLRRLAEQLANIVEHARIGGGVRAGRAANGLLVDIYDFVDVFKPLDALMPARLALGLVKPGGYALIENLIDQGGLAGAGHACHQCQCAQGKFHRKILQVVLPGPYDFQEFAVAGPALGGHMDISGPGQVLARDGGCHLLDIRRRALGDYLATVLTCARAYVDNLIRCPHGILVMLHHNQGIA